MVKMHKRGEMPLLHKKLLLELLFSTKKLGAILLALVSTTKKTG